MVRLPRRSLPLMARDIMSTPPITVSEDTPLKEVSKLMCDRKIGSVIVLASDGTVRGIITERRDMCYRPGLQCGLARLGDHDA